MSIILYPTPSESLVSLSVVKAALDYDADTTDDDTRIQRLIDDAAAQFIGACAQPIRATIGVYPVTPQQPGTWTPLRWRPCSALTLVERYDGAGVWTELDDSTVRLLDLGTDDAPRHRLEYDGGFTAHAQYRATMTVGYQTIPRDVQSVVANHAVLAYKDAPWSGTKGDRIGLASKNIQGEGGATGYTVTFDRKAFYANWASVAARYGKIPSF